MDSADIIDMALKVQERFELQAEEIEKLDQAIGDGDHLATMQRGFKAIVKLEVTELSVSDALKTLSNNLLSTMGGAAGPLFASFFLGMASESADRESPNMQEFACMFATGVARVKKRGKSDVGQKTMLDVLIPVSELFSKLVEQGASPIEILRQLPGEAEKRMLATKDMLATKGRASGLGERSLGHIDPGAKSCQVIISTVCDYLREASRQDIFKANVNNQAG